MVITPMTHTNKDEFLDIALSSVPERQERDMSYIEGDNYANTRDRMQSLFLYRNRVMRAMLTILKDFS